MIKTGHLSTGTGDALKTDNRIFFRNPLYDVKTQIKDVGTGRRFEAFIKDISGSGMGLSTDQGFRPGIIFEISLEIPDGFGPLKLLGKVIWSKEVDLFSFPLGKTGHTGDISGYRTGVVILNPRFMSVSRILKLFF